MAVRVVNSGPDTVKVSVEAIPDVKVSSPAVSQVKVPAQDIPAVKVSSPGVSTVSVSTTTIPTVRVSSPAVSPISVSIVGQRGPQGIQGEDGVGIPSGGLEGQALLKSSDTSYETEWDYIEATYLEVENDDGTSMPAGTLVYAKGVSGNNITVGRADASSSATMPAIGIVVDEITDGSTGHVITSGLFNKTISGLSGVGVGDTMYVSETAGRVTTEKPTGTALIQNIGVVLKTNGTNIQKMKVSSIDRVNDIPNIPEGYVWYGDSDGVPQPTSLRSLFKVVEDEVPQLGDDLDVQTYRLFTTATNQDIRFTPSGTGSVNLDGTVKFKRFTTPPTAFEGGMYADDSDNLYFGVS